METKANCRACLVQRRSLRSVFQRAGSHSHTYADLLCIVANVKIQQSDGFSDKICLICRRKAEEAYEFKTLVAKSDKLLWMGNNTENGKTASRKIVFNNASDIKVEIDGCKLENTLDNVTEDTKDLKLEFKEGEDKIFYNNTLIKKLIKAETTEITVDDFINNIKHELADVNDESNEFMHEADENDYYTDWRDDADDEYLPPGAKIISTKKSLKKCNYKKKKKNKDNHKGSPAETCDETENNNIKLKMRKGKIKPIYLDDVSVVPSKPRPHARMPRAKKPIKDRNRVCPYCAKVTKTLDSHLLLHTGERKYKCTECPKAYFSESHLKDHKITHTGIKPFKCDKCPAQFYKNISLISHMRSHKDIRDHLCNVCSKGFKRLTTLKRHMLRHSSANKSIKCELCNMSFFEKGQLKHHMRIHTGERPYKCEMCSQPYSYKHDFNRHCFKKHGVFMKRRGINIMNEQVLQQEREAVRAKLESQSDAQAAESVFQPPSSTRTFCYSYPHIVDAAQLKILFNNC